MYRPIIMACLALGISTTAWSDDRQLAGKKLIEWGWDEPDTQFIRQNIAQMERFPFDGLVFHVASSQGGNFTWEMWGSRKFNLSEFRAAIDDLNATSFHRFTDRFLRVNVAPGNVDWFDDQAWATVRENFAVAAQLARQGKCKGFMFDVEQYEGKPFDYHKQKHAGSKTFADYQAQVRKRGSDWMQAVHEQFPDITILLTFGYVITQPRGQQHDRADVSYGLLADFLDGALEGCSAQTSIVDAWERSYSYKEQERFKDAYETIKTKALSWTAAPEAYRKHVTAGFGVWMDNDWRKHGWNPDDVEKNFFTPAQFEAAVRSALQTSDKYVWIYTEQPRWWTSEKLPAPYADALRKARAPAAPR